MKNQKRKQSVTIKFHKVIYKLPALNLAVKAFSELGNFQVKNTKDYLIVNISDMNVEVADVISDEFSNYVLSLMKK